MNGESVESAAPTVSALVESLGLPPQTVLVEHNLRALLRSEWESTPLGEGDRIEILRVSAGG